MAPLLEDPRIRQTWNNISHNAETVTETAATGVWKLLHNYINPCLVSIGESCRQCTTQCFPDREESARRLRERERTRGRAEYSFDFYDDWDEDMGSSSGGLLGWGNDELDRLLAGSGSHSHVAEQPQGRKRKMSYGTRRPKRNGKMDGLPDPTVIPSTSALGFLQRLPFKFGSTLRYKPSAADLQDNPGAHRAELGNMEEAEPLIEEYHSGDGDGENPQTRITRERSSTQGSGATSDSFRSRGDLFPSDGEDDAVPLPDEFAISLTTRSGPDDRSSGTTKSSKGKGRGGARGGANILARTRSRASHSSSRSLAAMSSLGEPSPLALGSSHSSSVNMQATEEQSLSDLAREEERARKEEEAELGAKREAAGRLAVKRGLSVSDALASSQQAENSSSTGKSAAEHKSTVHLDAESPTSFTSSPDAQIETSALETHVPNSCVSHPRGSCVAPTPKSVSSGAAETTFVGARLPGF